MTKRFAVRLSRAAEADLDAIVGYVAEHGSPEIADKLLSELLERVRSLQDFPSRGNFPKEFEDAGVSDFRQLVRKPYRIFYHVGDEQVTVLLIADGRRDMQTLLRQRLLSR